MTPKRINIPKGSTCVMYLAYNLAFVLVTSRVREIVVWSSFGNLSAVGICIVVCVLGGGGGGWRGRKGWMGGMWIGCL